MPSPEQLAEAIKYLVDGLRVAKILDRSVGINLILNEPVFELKHCPVCNQMTNHLDGVCQKCKDKEPHETEEWGAWKIVEKMLDNPCGCGVYQTSECYQELYEFVMLQKQKARDETRDTPMGYSTWLTAGEKFGYLNFFQEQMKNN